MKQQLSQIVDKFNTHKFYCFNFRLLTRIVVFILELTHTFACCFATHLKLTTSTLTWMGSSTLTYILKRCSKKNVVNNVDMSSFRAPWQHGPYKIQHTERHKNTLNTTTQQTFREKNTLYFVFLELVFFIFIFIYNFFNEISKKCCL